MWCFEATIHDNDKPLAQLNAPGDVGCVADRVDGSRGRIRCAARSAKPRSISEETAVDLAIVCLFCESFEGHFGRGGRRVAR